MSGTSICNAILGLCVAGLAAIVHWVIRELAIYAEVTREQDKGLNKLNDKIELLNKDMKALRSRLP